MNSQPGAPDPHRPGSTGRVPAGHRCQIGNNPITSSTSWRN